MKVVHELEEKKEGEGECSFLLPDGKGGYLCFSKSQDSHYGGWLELDGSVLYKTIENIGIDKELEKLKISDGRAFRQYGETTETFQANGDVLQYSVIDFDGWINVDLDFRGVHDFHDRGRNYEFYEKGDLLIIKYSKYAGDEMNDLEKNKFLALAGTGEYYVEESWNFRNYEYDQERNSKSVFYTYGPLKLRVFQDAAITFARGNTEEEAIERAKKGFQKKETDVNDLKEEAFTSLDGLKLENGIMAGFPWFFQDWARDELISLKPYIMKERNHFVKKVLMKNLERMENGQLPNKGESSDLASADAAGWLFLRFDEFLKGTGTSVFNEEELRTVKDKLDSTVDAIRQDSMEDGLVVNGPLETWMDTEAGGDVRAGARIEIQALFLRMLKFGDLLAKTLGDKDNYNHMEQNIREGVREKMYSDGKLADGYQGGQADWTQRPNIFVACYACPDLLSMKEWNQAFDHALEKLWLDWGGLASIDKEHELYQEEYTGQTNESYHRGDSWYYVNNMAAICMHFLNRDKYDATVDKIKEASVEEMLYSGFAGHCAEVSSAKEQRSEGARCQAWSAATLYELLSIR